MPAGRAVRPEKWTDVTDLFDDGEYSMISGVYENDSRRAIGERWNGDESRPLGFELRIHGA